MLLAWAPGEGEPRLKSREACGAGPDSAAPCALARIESFTTRLRSPPIRMPDDNGNVLTDIEPGSVRRIHLVGVAGTGMGSFAGGRQGADYEVTGTEENVYPPMSDMLEAWGVR